MKIVRVALPIPLPQSFDYTAEDACESDIGRSVRVPFGRGELSGLIVELPDPAKLEVPAERLKPVLRILREVPPLPAEWLALVRFAASYYHAPLGEVIDMALPPRLRRSYAPRAGAPDPLLALTEAGRAAPATVRASRARSLAEALLASPPTRRSLLADAHDSATVSDALKRGWLQPVLVDDPAAPPPGLPPLTPAQHAATEGVLAALPGFQTWLLHGVTGSGKTEVYLSLAAACLTRGEQVLMLVPEIALTPQLERRIRARFPAAEIAALHSGLAEGERSSAFLRAQQGHAHLVLGTRLAVFTPLPRLGLIVVDEEHDPSYKQQEGIRYSARDVAIWRGHQAGVPVVLGSATPSLESWHHASTGRYRLLELPERAVASTLPEVRIVDTRRMPLTDGLSPPLLQALGDTLARGEQSLVYLNRRGYAPVLSCPACGWVSHCPNCSANLVLHLADRRLRCHHCGCESTVPRHCPSCGNADIQPFGRGTQRLEERLRESFPEAKVLRLDRDAARTPAQWEGLLAQIAAGEANVLVGTQMMAKGHNFPRLTLVGAIGADASLFAADFRGPERLFQQLMQVGGRAGRAELPGRVLVQTEYPDHPLYRTLARHDYPSFAAQALEERRQAGFPPFTFQAMLRADAPELQTALDFLALAVETAREFVPAGVFLFDPVPMRMPRLARRERAQLLVESPARPPLQAFLGRWVDALYALKPKHQLRWHVDVDPMDV